MKKEEEKRRNIRRVCATHLWKLELPAARTDSGVAQVILLESTKASYLAWTLHPIQQLAPNPKMPLAGGRISQVLTASGKPV